MITAEAWTRLRALMHTATPEHIARTIGVVDQPAGTGGCKARHGSNRCHGPVDHPGPLHTSHDGRMPVIWSDPDADERVAS